jgi:hypothetical protein
VANFLHELAAEFKLRGRARFFDQYPASSVLIGLGILGLLDENQSTKDGQTLRFSAGEGDEYIRSAALADRVWFLVKKPQNRKQIRIVVGRTAESDVTIPELSISTEHCAFSASPFGLRITDLGSTNGTFVDGHRLSKGETGQLQSGSKIILGRFEFEYLRHKDFLQRLQYARVTAGHEP